MEVRGVVQEVLGGLPKVFLVGGAVFLPLEVLGGLLTVFHVVGAVFCPGGAGWFAEGVSRWRCGVLFRRCWVVCRRCFTLEVPCSALGGAG